MYAPAITLWLFATSRTSLGFAFQATIAAEFIGAAVGLGYLLVQGQSTFDAARVWSMLLVMMVIGFLLDTLLGLLERRLTRWVPA